MTRMAEPERPRDEHDYDDERFEDEGRRSIFSALWFRAILVVIVLGVVVAVAVPYVLELANQPAPKTATLGKPEAPAVPVAPPAPPVASVPAPPAPAPEKSPAPEKPSAAERPAAGESSAPTAMTPATEKPVAKKPESSKPVVASKSAAPRAPAPARAPRASATPSPTGGSGDYFVQVGAFKNPDTARKLATRLREQKYNVEETSASGAKPARGASASAPPAATAPSPSDRYDVYVSGGAPAEINAKLSAKGLSAEPSGAGVVVRPSMPLRDAVALSKRQSSSVVESVFDIIFRCFEKGEDVKIVGFGHFRIRRKASRRGRNPQTGESIEITARKVLTFKPSKGLKQRINVTA